MDYKNVYEALVAVNEDIQAIAKTAENSFFNFKYAPIEVVYAACREAMYKHGVVLMSEIVENEMNSTTSVIKETYKGKETEKTKTSNYGTVVFNYKFYCGDSHTEPIRWIGEAMDTGDKTYSKAISFAQKTFLLTFFNIPRTDDPDGSGATGKATPHKQTNKIDTFQKRKSFYIKLFSKDGVNWMGAENKEYQTFKNACKKAGVGTWITAWANEDATKMQNLIKDSGINLNYKTVIDEKLIKAMKEVFKPYINGGK